MLDEVAAKRIERYRRRFVALHDAEDFYGMTDLAAELLEALTTLDIVVEFEEERSDVRELEKRIERLESAIESMYRRPILPRRKK
jgi:hypothetical protein